ncbi:MAG: type I-C CRISPR-associated endonuclease Cas1c [Planctomycetota bacterium]
MKRILNTLYVTTDGAYLARESSNVLVRVEKETRIRVPVHTLGGIVAFGRVSCSPSLMRLCAENDVAVSFLSRNGRFLARIQGPVSGNVLLRREQYRRADDLEKSADIARDMVVAKIANQRTVLLRAAREHESNQSREELRTAARRMKRVLDRAAHTGPLDSIRAREAEAAGAYFGVFDHLVTAQKDGFFFHERSRRPPLDNMNSLLSFFYVLLTHDVRSALESVGLDPAVGYLHRDRPGRPSLALDLMEELRPILADRLALSLVNRQQIKPGGMVQTESGAVRMDDRTRKTVLVAYQKRKQDAITHPFTDDRIHIGLLPHVQALLLARHLRGDLDGYPPFFWK